MKLTSITVRNFRSIRELHLDVHDLTTIIGRNSAGKSNILKALTAFFTFSDKSFSSHDLYEWRGDSEAATIECVFADLTEEEAAEVAKYVLPDRTIRVCRTIFDDSGRIRSTLRGVLASPQDEWLKPGFDRYNDAAFWSSLDINVFDYAEQTASGRVTRAAHDEFCAEYMKRHADQLKFSLELSDTEFKGRQSTAAQCLPIFTFVPATGEVADRVCGKSTSMLNIIVGAIIEGARDRKEYLAASESLGHAAELVNESDSRLPLLGILEQRLAIQLRSWGKVGCQIHTVPPEISKVLLDGLDIALSLDGHATDLRVQGEGIQRQVLFQVFRLYAEYRSKKGVFAEQDDTEQGRSHIIVFEEPELFLHPQAQEQFLDDLRAVAATDQVVVSTHSNHLLDLEHLDGLVVVRRTGKPKETIATAADPVWAQGRDRTRYLKDLVLLNRDLAKMFFADRIVLVEGDSDYVYLMGAAQRHLNNLDRRVAIVPCGGKATIPRLQEAVAAFALPHIVVYDKDPGNPASERDTAKIVQRVADAKSKGIDADVWECDPNLPTLAGCPNESDKVADAFEFVLNETPSGEFLAQVERLFELPA